MRHALRNLSVLLFASSSLLLACGGAPDGAVTRVGSPIKGGDHGDFYISSPAFDDGGAIPDDNTCNGKPFGSGTSPVLEWGNTPQHTMSFAIVFKDTSLTTLTPPDNRGWHWAIWDIQKDTNTLPAGLASTEFLDDPRFARQWSRYSPYGYLGPCPNFDPTHVPIHTDNYSFTLYAVDTKILDYPPPDPAIPNYTRVLDEYLAAHAIAQTELRGTAAAIPSAPPVPPGAPPAPSPRP
jgi:phosphatidylethanolamine-binding protein (PEBP) family uncharacterized protein